MHAVIQEILTDAGMHAEDIAVAQGLANVVRAECLDALASAADCAKPAHQALLRIYLARVVEAAMVEEYERWKTTAIPEA